MGKYKIKYLGWFFNFIWNCICDLFTEPRAFFECKIAKENWEDFKTRLYFETDPEGIAFTKEMAQRLNDIYTKQNNEKVLLSRYATKRVNSDFYGIVNVEKLDSKEADLNDKGQGYIWAPYIISYTDKSSDEYDKFMSDYHIAHEACPQCGETSHMSTLVGYVLNMEHKEDYKNLNRCTCDNCGDIHTCHERVSITKKQNE